jgi:dTDP-4-dehydrorhamnose reductase
MSEVDLFVLGATGLLGQALLAEAHERGLSCVGGARTHADVVLDVSDPHALRRVVRELAPGLIVNCVAITSLAACEQQPALAYAVNARPVALLAELALELGAGLVQISTDHYFSGDGAALHDERARVRLRNEYARTKYAAEAFALTAPGALVVRTNIVGLRGWPGRPTFAEWALGALTAGETLTLYEDFYTSSMHSRACAAAMLELAQRGAHGVLNVACAQVASKLEFVRALAAAAGIEGAALQVGSVRELAPPRAESLGLDVSRAERLLQRRLPGLADTVQALAQEWHGVQDAGGAQGAQDAGGAQGAQDAGGGIQGAQDAGGIQGATRERL